MVPRDDLGALYAKNMEHFGCGTAMFEPVASADMQPPCVGYVDHNRKWNWIANLTWPDDTGGDSDANSFAPLDRKPMKMEQLGIEWRPRLSKGTRQWNFDASGATPTGIPVGADGHIKYKSQTSFGAVLMTQKPITLTSYNDETLFKAWLSANRARLSSQHGKALRRYGLYLITTTYASPKVSINAWVDEDGEASVSVKVKASMMGDLGGDLDWTDKMTDKDWSHYSGKEEGSTVVIFYDGLEMPAWQWWWEGLKTKGTSRNLEIRTTSRSPAPQRIRARDPEQANSEGHEQAYSSLHHEDPSLMHDQHDDPPDESDIWGSDMPIRSPSPLAGRSLSRGRQPLLQPPPPSRTHSTPTRLSEHMDRDNEASESTEGLLTKRTSVQRFSTASTATASSTMGHQDCKDDTKEVSSF